MTKILNANASRLLGLPSWRARKGKLSAAGIIGASLMVLVLLVVTVGPMLWQVSPQEQDLGESFLAASREHPLGTDNQGRDLLARLMVGGQMSLLIGVSGMLVGLCGGLLLGVSAGIFRGAIEAVCLRLVDALLALPGIVQAVIFVAVIGYGPVSLVVALGIYSVPIFARVAYSATLQVTNEDYFSAARVLGASRLRIIFEHVLPNIAAPIIVIASLHTGSNILTAAALNFFGLGVQPPAAEWGLMIADARDYSYQSPMLLIIPGIALVISSLAFNLLGDGLRDWLDPKARNR